MKTLFLDIHKWRSGGLGKNRLGPEVTALLNEQGGMCCLGQFALQGGIQKKDILNKAVLGNYHGPLGFGYSFTGQAMSINDLEEVPINTRIQNLKKHCREHNIKLTLKNDSAFRKNGSINWSFIANMFSATDVTEDVTQMSSHEIEAKNKYCRAAIRKVGKKKFVTRVLKKLG